jgi:hypothetical protein
MENERVHHSARATGDPSSCPQEIQDRAGPLLVPHARSPPSLFSVAPHAAACSAS